MITLNLHPAIALTDEQFEQICRNNRELRFERTATGELVVMAPTGSETGNVNLNLGSQLWLWNQATRLGKGFDSSTGFKLPNGATRSPDVAWVRLDRWQALTPEQQRRFAPLCPDFVIELRSPSDDLVDVQAKMQEYLDNGLQLGWLIDRELGRVEVYRQVSAGSLTENQLENQPVEVLDHPQTISGDPVLPGFVLDLSEILSS